MAGFSSTAGENKKSKTSSNEKTKIKISKLGKTSKITFSDVKLRNIENWRVDQ